jgi:hypothetical protein
LVALELGSVLEASERVWEARVRCEANRVDLRLNLGAGEHRLRRYLEFPEPPERERVIALAVAGLYRARFEPPIDASVDATSPITDTPDAATTPRPALDAPRRHEQAQRLRVGPALGLSYRALDVPLWYLGSSASLWTDQTQTQELSLRARLEWGESERALGRVRTNIWTLGGGYGLTLFRYRNFDLTLLVNLAGAFVEMQGQPRGAEVQAGTVRGFSADLSTTLVPRFRWSGFELLLQPEVGHLLQAPRGTSDQSDAVQVNGVWVGAGLVASVQL